MPENKIITLIITTRAYPSSSWNIHCELKWDFDQLEFDDKSEYNCEEVFIKALDFEPYRVFVVPCLQKCVTNDNRRKYLEYVINTICNGIDLHDVYLVAHDKDFNRNEKGAIVTKKDVPEGNSPIPSLLKIIDNRHAFMFQHDDSRVRKIITNIKDGFEKEDCRKLVYDVVEPERKMREFFQSVNDQNDFVYPDHLN